MSNTPIDLERVTVMAKRMMEQLATLGQDMPDAERVIALSSALANMLGLLLAGFPSGRRQAVLNDIVATAASRLAAETGPGGRGGPECPVAAPPPAPIQAVSLEAYVQALLVHAVDGLFASPGGLDRHQVGMTLAANLLGCVLTMPGIEADRALPAIVNGAQARAARVRDGVAAVNAASPQSASIH